MSSHMQGFLPGKHSEEEIWDHNKACTSLLDICVAFSKRGVYKFILPQELQVPASFCGMTTWHDHAF